MQFKLSILSAILAASSCTIAAPQLKAPGVPGVPGVPGSIPTVGGLLGSPGSRTPGSSGSTGLDRGSLPTIAGLTLDEPLEPQTVSQL
ncbi:uncharacterized protein N7483_012962 [Penicillium malachiteum]|uniref:uncharacterized protein n=1 Tax=Penicillium malachiteum TaxID=1324776 RepID=UPI0025489B23|nr:uncharacterized protein N7483_012962 [Penicillium malachiteum]KAJ5715781.1 hypothetical protein N7483_012962 [Penicillium malachiteum]